MLSEDASLVDLLSLGVSDIHLESSECRSKLKREVISRIAMELDKRCDAVDIKALWEDIPPSLQPLADGLDWSHASTRVADSVVGAWAASANRHLVSISLQLAAESHFRLSGCDPIDITAHGANELQLARKLIANHAATLDTLVEIIHSHTSGLLGPGFTRVFRGMRVDPESEWITNGTGSLRRVTSCTARHSVAKRFAFEPHGTPRGVPIVISIPTTMERILSTALTGPGSAHEFECLLLGGRVTGCQVDVLQQR